MLKAEDGVVTSFGVTYQLRKENEYLKRNMASSSST